MKQKLNHNFVKEKYNSSNNYEYNRWFTTQKNRTDYKIMSQVINFHLKDISFKKCFELGPGPGTWTKLLLARNNKAKFVLTDISKEMINQAKKTLKNNKNIKFKVSDFLKLEIKEKFDFFFSSRVLEYITDKESAIKKIYSLLEKGGKGILITKEPHPFKLRLRKFLGKEIKTLDTGRISYLKLKKLLERNKFKNIEIYPALAPWFPYFNSFRLLLSRFIYKKKLNLFSRMLIESYLIRFEK